MGSLGDKFKKLAGDQTRQLLQNFQNAQSSKSKNGYSYGKLNEDGTATLADGTVVQVEVKGRPGQYAPVFNLGNGQGLVDQPEAKFFNIDSNVKNPWHLIAYDGETITLDSRTIQNTLYLRVVEVKTGLSYNIPPEIYPQPLGPRTNQSVVQNPFYVLTVNNYFDFSLDGKHIILNASSGEPFKVVGNVGGFGYEVLACDLNYCIIENWKIVDGEFAYESLRYFTMPSTTYLQYSADTPSETFNTDLGFNGDSSTAYTAQINYPVPILYSSEEGVPTVDFWIASRTVIYFPYIAGFSPFSFQPIWSSRAGTSYKTTYIKDYLDSNEVTVLYNQQVGGSNLTSYSQPFGDLDATIYFNTSPDPGNLTYVGSYAENYEVNHIVGAQTLVNYSANLYLYQSELWPPTPSQGAALVSNYCTLNTTDFQLQNIPESNTYSIGAMDNFFSTFFGETEYNIIAPKDPNIPYAFIGYDNAIIVPGSTPIRYGELKKSLEELAGVSEINQAASGGNTDGSYTCYSLPPFALMDTRTIQTLKRYNMFAGYYPGSYYSEYLYESQSNFKVTTLNSTGIKAYSADPWLLKFGVSRGYSQKLVGKIPVLVIDPEASYPVLYEISSGTDRKIINTYSLDYGIPFYRGALIYR